MKKGKMIIIFELSQSVDKKQQPEVIGLGVASFTYQNSGMPWTHVNTLYVKEVMSNVW
jgi:hypothetical protein